ncbi:SPOR domain-containing protein [Rothia sp. ZJ932]|uniref:SPOR domain-containing protein n=1 Tax=Rothia sp. ZJ932 TaxID=2810516 RepID=UPI0019688E69|nr:SPOR domain-containing protein [Rothia sp. ZJ932]QRZ60919.1 SPOR domain-containing protein [Rothia sp. ZJ932]
MSQLSDDLPGSTKTEYWYNTSTGEVEEGQQSAVTKLWGPYATYEEAANAMKTAQARNEQWEEENKRWAEG